MSLPVLDTPGNQSERGQTTTFDSLLFAAIVALSLLIVMLLVGISTTSITNALEQAAADLADAATGLVQG